MALRAPVRRIWDIRLEGTWPIAAGEPCLVVSNHESYIDPWVLCLALPHRPIRFLIGEAWYRRSPLWHAAFRGYGAIPIASNDPLETLRRVRAALLDGDAVGLFPEGRISLDGSALPFQPGVALMAATSGARVVPCALAGTREAAPWPRKVPRRVPIRVAVGEAIQVAGSPMAHPSSTMVLEVTSRIAARVASLRASISA